MPEPTYLVWEGNPCYSCDSILEHYLKAIKHQQLNCICNCLCYAIPNEVLWLYLWSKCLSPTSLSPPGQPLSTLTLPPSPWPNQPEFFQGGFFPGSWNKGYDHIYDIDHYHNNKHYDDIKHLDNDYHNSDQKLQLLKDHNKDNCDGQEHYLDHGDFFWGDFFLGDIFLGDFFLGGFFPRGFFPRGIFS